MSITTRSSREEDAHRDGSIIVADTAPTQRRTKQSRGALDYTDDACMIVARSFAAMPALAASAWRLYWLGAKLPSAFTQDPYQPGRSLPDGHDSVDQAL